ncbi:MAG: preprotein translocase subunit YajC [Steroidobacter sp.]
MDGLISTAAAQAANGAPATPGAQFPFFMLILMVVVFYFVIFRPQNKRAKEHRALIASIEAGAEVATNGGIVGKVTEVSDNFFTVEIASNVQVKVQRNTIAQVFPKGTLKNG